MEKKQEKKQEAVTYYQKEEKIKNLLLIIYQFFIALTLLLFVYGLSPSNTHSTNGFRASSEEGARSCVCLFKPTQHKLSNVRSRQKRKKKQEAVMML